MKQLLLILSSILLFSTSIQALNLYWKGGNGDFNDPNMWWVGSFNSGITHFQAPISTDHVYFTLAAFNGNGPTSITINSSASCGNMIWDNTILAADQPTLSSPKTINLDVYGKFSLATNMDFNFNGNLRLRSQQNGIIPIWTRGQAIRVVQLEFDGSDSTIFELQDSLYVTDPLDKPHTGNAEGSVLLMNGHLDFNEQYVKCKYFNSTTNQKGRGLDISNSTIVLFGSYPYRYQWNINFNAQTATPNFSYFDAVGSKIHFPYYNNTYWKNFSGGIGIQYDSLVSDNQTLMRDGYVVFNYVELNKLGRWSHDITFEVEDLYLKGGEEYQFLYQKDTLIVENIHINRACNEFITFNALKESQANTRGVIKKRTPGTLTTDRFILYDMDCDETGGTRSYVSNNSLKFGTTVAWWTINPPVAGQDFYFRDFNNNQRWTDPSNWEIWNGSAFVANTGNCLPTPMDNVYFDNQSFPNATKLVTTDSIAYCHDMRWLTGVAPSSTIQLTYPINIYGTMQLESSMSTINGGYIRMRGSAPDSIIANGVRIWTYLQFMKYSDYHIAGDTDPSTIDLWSRYFYAYRFSTIRTDNVDIKTLHFYLYNRIMDSTQVYFDYNGGNAYDYGHDTLSYTGNTTFHFNGDNTNSTINVYSGTYPNIIGNCYTYFRNGTFNILGDLTFNNRANFYPTEHTSNYVRVNVLGTMPLYNGDMYLIAGQTYQFCPHPNSYLNVVGKLSSMGDCQRFIKFKTSTGAPVPITIGDIASSNIQYTYLEGWDNSANPVIPTVNSIDGGNNSNWNFASAGTGVTYYWRAHSTDPTDFDGNWDDPGHWTTNPASLVGDSSCIPTVLDSVIFDNLSLSLTSNGCLIDDVSFCRTLVAYSDVAIKSPSKGAGTLYVGESFILDLSMTNYNFSGGIIFVGSGAIRTSGTPLVNHGLFFSKSGGVWDLESDLNLSNTVNVGYGRIFFDAGTLNTNDYNINANIWTTRYSRRPMTWNFGASIINIYGRTTWSGYIWAVYSTDSLQLNAGTSVIHLDNQTTANRSYYMGRASNKYPLKYNIINFIDQDYQSNLVGTADFNYLNFSGNGYITGNNSCDSIFLKGGYFYYIGQNRTLTLNAPHGKIITDAGPGAFVNLETTPSSGISYIHKPYGSTFCIDYIKVKNNKGTKAPLATVPVAYQAIHNILKYETGVNSDNINGSATGIWDFSLPVLMQPKVTGDTIVQACSVGAGQGIPVELIGTSPYTISYNWIDDLGNTANPPDTIVYDDDNDPNTPFIYNFSIPAAGVSTDYYLNISTYRCGEETNASPAHIRGNVPSPNVLVQVQRRDTCTLYNDPTWYTFMDDIDGRPILSLQDKTGGSDTDTLGEVAIEVDFDATVQYLGSTPYLQRHWVIEPENNVAANVRLYFTQEELDSLTQHTFVATLGRSLLADIEIQVRKFDSGIIGVGPSTVIPHTVVAWNASTTVPFSTVADVIGVEFAVPSFSAFIIEPTIPALLNTELVKFEAKATAQNQVQISWSTEDAKNLKYFIVQRSKDGYIFDNVSAPILSQNTVVDNAGYEFMDNNPFTSTSYYRLQLVDTDGQIYYSDLVAVTLEGVEVINIYPNPVRDNKLHIHLTTDAATEVDLRIVDELGRVLQTYKQQSQVGQNDFQLNIHNLSNGIYLLQLSDDRGYTQQRRFTVYK